MINCCRNETGWGKWIFSVTVQFFCVFFFFEIESLVFRFFNQNRFGNVIQTLGVLVYKLLEVEETINFLWGLFIIPFVYFDAHVEGWFN
jgi:hypothetical protein